MYKTSNFFSQKLHELGFHESRYFTFDDIEIPMKFYHNYVEI
jgi:hypothetical protein